MTDHASPSAHPTVFVDGGRPLLSRRVVLTGAIGTVVLASRAFASAPLLPPTPAQTAGPFYPASPPLDSDADLIRVAGRGDVARGTPLAITGRVLDARGRPVPGALIEIWQCDALGRYHHPLDGGGADPAFQGYGRTEANAAGLYRFRTIRPVAYGARTPHVHFRITAPGVPALTTQMYVAGEPRNAQDFVLAAIRDPAARARVIVPLAPAPDGAGVDLIANFDIVLAA